MDMFNDKIIEIKEIKEMICREFDLIEEFYKLKSQFYIERFSIWNIITKIEKMKFLTIATAILFFSNS